MRVEDGNGEAEYLQLARALRQQITDGALPVGEPLPSSRAVREKHGIGRTTWGRAVAELRRQGLVSIRRGQGAWVTSRPAVTVLEVTAGDRVSARAPTQEERGRLGSGPLMPVLVITRATGEVEVHPAAVTVCLVAR